MQYPFFVYGTLLPNQPNAYYFADAILVLETAVIHNARLYDFGNYPMLVESDNSDVKGMLIFVDETLYDTIAMRLDELEGYDPTKLDESEYVRVKRDVELQNGRKQTAWVYLGNLNFEPSVPIVKDGDWATYMAHKQEDVHTWWQTIDSVAGLHKNATKRTDNE